jgi:alanine dehydrogenase
MYTIGIPREIKDYENRVSIIPSDIQRLLENNDDDINDIVIYVQAGAGEYAGYSDDEYIAKGAIILNNLEDIYEKADIIVKVKEPQRMEYSLIKPRHTILSFFHFAGNNDLIEAMIESKAKCYAYETIQDENGVYPILAPMSIIAGKKSMIEADNFISNSKKLRKNKYTIITIVGVGNAGKAAAEQAILMGYKNINLIDNDYEKIKRIEESNPTIYKAYKMTENNVRKLLIFSNIVISSIYNNGMKASHIIDNELLDMMSKTGSVIMDIAIDQGGTTSQSMPTTLYNPFIRYKNTSIYCVPNIPSTAPTEASIKLSNTIYPYLNSLLLNDNDNGNGNSKYLEELHRGLYVNFKI